jgi:endonuclease/exonuclease/phosphatase family metal-dependent hydrolase
MQNDSRKSIHVLIWNLSWLYGLGSEGADYTPRSKAFFQERLERAARILSEFDLVLLQDVDLGARRSHSLDQSAELAKLGGFAMHRPHVSWDAAYIPFPFFPPWAQWGRTKSGSTILSKVKLGAERSILFDPVASQPFWYRPFYPRRYAHAVRLADFPEAPWVVNLHLEAFDAGARAQSIDQLAGFLGQLRKEGPLALVSGDFNSMLAHAPARTRFQDRAGVLDYTGDETPARIREKIMMPLGLKDVLGLSEDRPEFWTFPVPDVQRRLDYALVPSKKILEISDARVLTTTGTLSDHYPIRFTISW